jgi:hypothetical protein
MTSYLHRQPRRWHRQLILGDRVDFATEVSDRIHLSLLEQWDEPVYTAPSPRRSRRAEARDVDIG